jgi:uncharacterized protein DUF4019
MNPKLLFILATVLSGAFGFLPAASAQTAAAAQAEQQQVRQAAESWLALMDSGKVADGWKALSTSASSKVNQAKWASAFAKTDQEFGARQGREFKSANLMLKAQAGGNQDLYLLEFQAVSITKGALREIVRVVKDVDGQWRVIGYTVEQQHPGGDDEGESGEKDRGRDADKDTP